MIAEHLRVTERSALLAVPGDLTGPNVNDRKDVQRLGARTHASDDRSRFGDPNVDGAITR